MDNQYDGEGIQVELNQIQYQSISYLLSKKRETCSPPI